MNYLTEVKAIKEVEEGTYLKVFIPKEYVKDTIERFKQGNKAFAEIRLDDNRRITNEQRKKYFATLKDIADYTGNVLEDMHDYFKFIYCYRNRQEYISMSDCSVTEAREMINIILDFALENDIPLSDLGINRTDDINRYLYSCLINRRCMCCGKKADIHHVDKVGMGRNRNKINHVGLRAMSLCRVHHTESHNIGEKEFYDKYKVHPIKLDEIAVKKLGL
ncbi:protein of unknown function DUF968 [Gottschalkia purinilytica]|uniref:Phage protein n=1 Tax=Gottschalkia purinilytica TaxID=1503 RepID=A0A0L0W6P4_GOTPU|nr:putative HNHc nuclease [Gottschalkia purinilytica]KNF07152.1 protein of unknown function DUF968 [Gottschalkia purinilytica]